MELNLNNKTFKALSNSDNGQVSEATVFQYFQEDGVIWAEYQGGEIKKGTIIGTINGTKLSFIYQHLSINNELKSGKCISQIEVNSSGKYVLKENWQWTSGDLSKGTSVLIEEGA